MVDTTSELRDLTLPPTFTLLIDPTGRIMPQYCAPGIASDLVEPDGAGSLQLTGKAARAGFLRLRDEFLKMVHGRELWQLYTKIYRAGVPNVWDESYYPPVVKERQAAHAARVREPINFRAELEKLLGRKVEAPPRRGDDADELAAPPEQPLAGSAIKRGVS